jgi:hypothetical protein
VLTLSNRAEGGLRAEIVLQTVAATK